MAANPSWPLVSPTSFEKSVGTEHPDLPLVVNNLADICQAQRRYSEAESLYRRALATNQRLLGPDHPDTAKIINDLGTLYFEQKNYGKAETLYRRALAIRRNLWGLTILQSPPP